MSMENLRLILPTVELETNYLDLVEDWKTNDGENLPWYLNIAKEDFPATVEKLNNMSKGIGIEDQYVENTTYWLVNRENKILGILNIRHRLNEWFLKYAGQIGYGIRPGERRKGYATEILRLALVVCREMGMEKVLVCCNNDNIGSMKTILRNGGIFDSEGEYNGRPINRYWIHL